MRLLPLKLFLSLGFFCYSQLLHGEVKNIDSFLAQLIGEDDIPGMAAVGVHKGEVVIAGKTGIRKKGSKAPVTMNDEFHIGSNTKSFTALLASILVKQGKITWASTPSDIWPKLKIHPGYAKATLELLCSNTAGVPGEIDSMLWMSLWENKSSATKQRQKLVGKTLTQAPKYEPGMGYTYSNTSFSIAGAMLEYAAKKSWEQLVHEEIFVPLNLKTGGFRAPAKNSSVNQPYGHDPDPVDPEPNGDNPRAIAPAGAIHMSMVDLAKYCWFHTGNSPIDIATKEELDFLHKPRSVEEQYAMGWAVSKPDFLGGRLLLAHAGSNTFFYNVMWCIPDYDFAVVVACNIGSEEAEKKCYQAVWKITESIFNKNKN